MKQILGIFLWHGRAADLTTLIAFNVLAAEKANLMAITMEKFMQFLDYCASQNDAVITYKASDLW